MTLLRVLPILPILLFAACAADDSSDTITRTHQISFATPTPGWKLHPVAAYLGDDAIHTVFQLEGPEGMVAQVISQTSGQISFRAPDSRLPVRTYVLGKTWNWAPETDAIFPPSQEALDAKLGDAKPLELISTAD